MAYGLVASSSQYLTASGIVSSNLTPMTLACWARPYTDARSVGTASVLLCVQQANTTHRNQLSTITASSSSFRCQANAVGSTTNGAADTTATTSANTWTHFAGVFTSSTSRTSYIAGVNPVTNTTNIGTQLSGNIVRIGTRFTTSLGVYGNADMCEIGVWSVALNTSELAALAKGIACDMIRPQSLIFYAPLIRDLVDLRGGVTITNTNSATITNHPRIYI
jgi:hypothetical protein